MKTQHCCNNATRDRDNTPLPVSHKRRGAELAGWLVPSAMLALLPKCPVCVAMYVALFSGVGISVASAAILRTSLLVLCITILFGLALMRLVRMAHEKNQQFALIPRRMRSLSPRKARLQK